MLCYLIVDVLPVVEGDELKSSEHGPEEVIKAGVPVVRILTHANTRVVRVAVPVTSYKHTCQLLYTCHGNKNHANILYRCLNQVVNQIKFLLPQYSYHFSLSLSQLFISI